LTMWFATKLSVATTLTIRRPATPSGLHDCKASRSRLVAAMAA
jgi:hypothetical protein